MQDVISLDVLKDMKLKKVVVQDTRKIFKSKTVNAWKRAMKPKQCYKNAWEACQHNGVSYVEGYIVVSGVAVHHAWCRWKNDKYFDPTTDIVLDTTCDSWHVIGELDRRDLDNAINIVGCWGPVFEQTERGFELCKCQTMK